MEIETIMQLVTIVVTLVLGIISKKNKYISDNLIPIQNITVGIIITIIMWIITKDFTTAYTLCSTAAGGIYDIAHNIQKLINKE